MTPGLSSSLSATGTPSRNTTVTISVLESYETFTMASSSTSRLCPVRYAVTISAGRRSRSTNTRTRKARPAASAIREHGPDRGEAQPPARDLAARMRREYVVADAFRLHRECGIAHLRCRGQRLTTDTSPGRARDAILPHLPPAISA